VVWTGGNSPVAKAAHFAAAALASRVAAHDLSSSAQEWNGSLCVRHGRRITVVHGTPSMQYHTATHFFTLYAISGFPHRTCSIALLTVSRNNAIPSSYEHPASWFCVMRMEVNRRPSEFIQRSVSIYISSFPLTAHAHHDHMVLEAGGRGRAASMVPHTSASSLCSDLGTCVFHRKCNKYIY
jgi:hypothetical protein